MLVCVSLALCVCLSVPQAQRKLDAAESRAASASSRVSELTQQLGGAEDQIVSLEGHISVLEEQLAGYTQLPQ
jgi:predicted  nucleic acid-binding Zn-ribbon protein